MRLFLLISLTCLCTSSIAQKNFTTLIKGTADNSITKVYLKYDLNGVSVNDSVPVINGSFQIRKEFAIPLEANLSVDKKLPPASLFLEDAEFVVNITDSIRILHYPASYSYYLDFVSITNALVKLYPLYGKLSRDNDSEGLKKLSAKFDSLNRRTATLAKKYFDENPGSALSLFCFEKFAPTNMNYELNEPYYNKLPAWAKGSNRGKEILETIEGAKRTKIGVVAPIFTANDTLGSAFTLSSLKGKYVLIDFWASWCKPCRAENPNLRVAYNNFNKNGFEILGVALEYPDARPAWTKAIIKDSLPWKQVTNLAFFNDPVAKLYGVQALPRNFLLDPDGKIIDRDLRGEFLVKRLKEIFNKP